APQPRLLTGLGRNLSRRGLGSSLAARFSTQLPDMSTDLEGFSSRRATPQPASTTPAARLARRIPRARTISIESTFLVTFPRPPSQVARTTISEVDPLPRSRAPAQAQSAAQQHYIEDEGGPA